MMTAVERGFVCLLCAILIVCVIHGQECDRHIMGREGRGTIYSENFPFDYKDNRNCRYRIYLGRNKETSARALCFTFYRFQLESTEGCSDDYLQFPGTGNDPTIKYCGNGTWSKGELPGASVKANIFAPDLCWKANDNIFEIIFRSSHRYHLAGFYAKFVVTSSSILHQVAAPQSPDGAIAMIDDGGVRSHTIGPAHSATAPCSKAEWTCFTRECVPHEALCNGVEDCTDGSDESYTHARCKNSQDITACDFESTGHDAWCHLAGNNWEKDGQPVTGPDFDHTFQQVAAGHFLFSQYRTFDATLYYVDVPLSQSSQRCLSFWYFMNVYVGSLNVHIVPQNNSQSRSATWHRRGSYGTRWQHGEIDIPHDSFPLQKISFVATPGKSYQSGAEYTNVAIDDISLLPGPCVADDISCTFEGGLCGWTSDEEAQTTWRRWRGEAPVSLTGPTDDVSGGGYYVNMEATDVALDNTARLVSRSVSHGSSGARCLKFHYHMSGEDMGTLEVKVADYLGHETRHWTARGDQGKGWNQQRLTIEKSPSVGPYQIIFQGTMGTTFTSSIALDDIELADGFCSTNNGDPDNRTPATPTPRNGGPEMVTCSPEMAFRCASGHCVPEVWVCDGRSDCPDRTDDTVGSDELNCPSDFSTERIVWIICVSMSVVSALSIFLTVFIRRTKRRQQTATAARIRTVEGGSDVSFGGHVVTEEDPPPPYTFSPDNPSLGVTQLSYGGYPHTDVFIPPSAELQYSDRDQPPPYTSESAPNVPQEPTEPERGWRRREGPSAAMSSLLPRDEPPPAYDQLPPPRRTAANRRSENISPNRARATDDVAVATAPLGAAGSLARSAAAGCQMSGSGEARPKINRGAAKSDANNSRGDPQANKAAKFAGAGRSLDGDTRGEVGEDEVGDVRPSSQPKRLQYVRVYHGDEAPRPREAFPRGGGQGYACTEV